MVPTIKRLYMYILPFSNPSMDPSIYPHSIFTTTNNNWVQQHPHSWDNSYFRNNNKECTVNIVAYIYEFIVRHTFTNAPLVHK